MKIQPQISLLIRMEFSSFEDYWRPFTAGEGFRSNTRPDSPRLTVPG
jgi:hypothetical protein